MVSPSLATFFCLGATLQFEKLPGPTLLNRNKVASSKLPGPIPSATVHQSNKTHCKTSVVRTMLGRTAPLINKFDAVMAGMLGLCTQLAEEPHC